jgi:hypothetical protein
MRQEERLIDGINMVKLYYMYVQNYHNKIPHFVELI